MPAQNSDARARTYFPVRNTSTEWIPAGALLAPLSTGDDGVINVGKPTADNQLGLLVNGFSPIPPSTLPDNEGQAYTDARCTIACANDVAGEPVGNSVSWGSKAGEWVAFPNRGGFRLLEQPSDGPMGRLVNAVRSNEIVFYARITSATPASASTTTTTTPAPSSTSSTTSTCVPTSTTTSSTTTSTTTTTSTPHYTAATGANYYPAVLVYFLASADVWVETQIPIWFRDVYARRPAVGDLVRVDQFGEYFDRPLYVGYDVPQVDGTTTTTTTPQPCGGLSKWIFNFTLGIWELSEVCCSPGCVPNAPTFCPSPGDGCGTTQTYCVRPRATPTTPSTPCPDFTTTTTTTPGPTTTTTPCPTTTPQPGCSGCTYTWIPNYGWVTKVNNCLAELGCSCPPPTAGAGSVCYDLDFACATTTTTPPPVPFCFGECRWVWIDEDTGWLFVSGGCTSNFPACKTCGPCVRPTVPPANPDCGTQAITGCDVVDSCPTTTTPAYNPCTPTTPAPPTTTTSTPPCSGVCRWRWSALGSEWIFLGSTNCTGNCDCYEPIYDGVDDCSVDQNRCAERTTTTTSTTTTPGPTTTTTTTTTTSSTTTTTTPPAFYCVTYGPGCSVPGQANCFAAHEILECGGILYYLSCGSICTLSIQSGPHGSLIECEDSPCDNTTTTTTTPAPTTTTTTTTPAPTTTTTTTTTTSGSGPGYYCPVEGGGLSCAFFANNPGGWLGPWASNAICQGMCGIDE